MHTYDVDSDERKVAIVALVLPSLGVAAAVHAATLLLDLGWLWLVDLPTPLGAFGLLYFWLEQWGLRSTWVRRALRIKTPMLAGDWTGTLWSSHDNESRDFSLHIDQTWTRILVRGRGAHSASVSKTASILTAEALHPILVYTFLNTPRADAVETMHMHHGTATHYLDEQANTLNGDYYTGRDRHTHGTMELVRSA